MDVVRLVGRGRRAWPGLAFARPAGAEHAAVAAELTRLLGPDHPDTRAAAAAAAGSVRILAASFTLLNIQAELKAILL
jgi:hypothetical protein